MAWLDSIDNRDTRRLTRDLRRGALETRDMAQDQFDHLSQHVGDLARRTAHDVADYGRQEGTILARAAAAQATRLGRAARADPIPVLVGAIGLALFASLVLRRR